MSAKTSIEWTDRTWNPVRGCSMVSEGCRNCYAMRQASRFSGPGQPYEGLAEGGKWTGEMRLSTKVLEEVLHWRKPQRIFVNSMSDLFHEKMTEQDIDFVFSRMAGASPLHTFQILTKRPARMFEYMIKDRPDRQAVYRSLLRGSGPAAMNRAGVYSWPPNNVWLGVSVEDQKAADERIPLLIKTPAAVRFLSCEPLLGPLELSDYLEESSDRDEMVKCCGEPMCEFCDGTGWCATRALRWVIVGGESGPGARPMHPDWVRSIRDQCQDPHVPFFFKQWGEWKPGSERSYHEVTSAIGFERVGKKAAGAMLDGREWREFPK